MFFCKRDAIIERFSQSIVGDFRTLNSDESTFGDGDEGPEGREPDPTSSQAARIELKGGFLHSVSEDCDESTLKLFNLRDTGSGMLERTLVHPGHRAQEAVYRGFTCRAARWDPDQGCYVFNGRSGSAIERAKEDLNWSIVPTCSFVRLYGQLQQADEPFQGSHGDEVPTLHHWNFTAEAPTVNQYLDGMGRTELVDPETAMDPSEVPSDARRYNAEPKYQARVLNRIRKVAPIEPLSDEDHDSTSDEDKDEGADDSSSTDDESSEKAAVLNKYRNTAINQPTEDAAHHIPVTGGSQQALRKLTSTAHGAGIGSVIGPSCSQPQDLTASAHTTTMPNYDRSYARVDKNGLTGNAGMQAQWEHINPKPSPRRSNRHGIARRAPTQIQDLSPKPTSKSSIPMSLSTDPELQTSHSTPTPNSSFSIAPPLTMLEGCFDTEPQVEPEQQPWATRSQTTTARTGNLIDVSLPSLPRSRDITGHVRAPPGLEQPCDRPIASSLRRSAATASLAVPKKEESVCEDLIDLTYSESAGTKPSTKISWNAQPLKPTVRLPSGNNSSVNQAKDCIVERLQNGTNWDRPVRYTMRQKAGKKNKANKASATPKPKVQLPKPSPPPPPRLKAKTKETATSDQAQHPTSDGRNNRNNEKPIGSHIERLLRRVEHLNGRQDVELQVSFGMVVVRPGDSTLSTGMNWSSSALQRRLQTEEDSGGLRTDFFERLTTSDVDAAFMYGLLPGEDLQPRVEYEITIRLLQGETRVIKFDQKKPDDFAVFCPEGVAVTLYMHYPVRVHDGRSRLVNTEPALNVDSEKVALFISSFHSVNEAPSFMALVPTQLFSVDRVHIKKIFAKQIVPGVQLELEEVQDLKLDPVDNDKNFNLKATAASIPFMVDNHRLWYECSLYLAPLGSVQGSVLQALVNQMVAEIDGVGFHNKGPYYRTEVEQEPEPEVKFW